MYVSDAETNFADIENAFSIGQRAHYLTAVIAVPLVTSLPAQDAVGPEEGASAGTQLERLVRLAVGSKRAKVAA